jgi:DNA polymerase-4
MHNKNDTVRGFNPKRRIIHVDMDAFYASVEQLDNPRLKGKPVIVGRIEGRGVVAAASYEARRFGVRSAMPMAKAKELCPKAVFLPPRFERYKEISSQIQEILRSYTPLVEGISLDEAFLDVTGHEAETIAKRIKQRIKEEIKLTCSIGIAPNKFLAKLASNLGKPDGFTLIRGDEVDEVLKDLPVSMIWGVGEVTEKRLHELGIHTIGELRKVPLEELVARFGKHGERLYNLSRGVDNSPINPKRKAKSISHEVTFPKDLYDPEEVKRVLHKLSEEVGRRLRRKGLKGRTIEIKVRYPDFSQITRSLSLDMPTDSTDTIWSQAERLFERNVRIERGIRLIGVGVSNLTEKSQLLLFDQDEKLQRIDKVVDEIRERFGKDSIRRGFSIVKSSTAELPLE